MRLVVGTRGSPLAVRQAEIVCDLIRAVRPDIGIVVRTYETSGDVRQDVPVSQLSPDAFTDRVEQALLDGEVDVAVHSYKDLPERATAGLVIAAVPVRADTREALVARDGLQLAELPPGAVVGISSERRAAAVRAQRPDLVLRPIRGAIDVRVAKVDAGQYDATVLAAAGLDRLGLIDRVTEFFDVAVMPPTPGQGALAVQCRADGDFALAILEGIDDSALHASVDAERSGNMSPAQT